MNQLLHHTPHKEVGIISKHLLFYCFRKNFLKLDIFYEKLGYQIIEQNPAFEFLSLLSEIGGLLGLLLGASVLTVCELLDFISSIAVNQFSKSKTDVTAFNTK